MKCCQKAQHFFDRDPYFISFSLDINFLFITYRRLCWWNKL